MIDKRVKSMVMGGLIYILATLSVNADASTLESNKPTEEPMAAFTQVVEPGYEVYALYKDTKVMDSPWGPGYKCSYINQGIILEVYKMMDTCSEFMFIKTPEITKKEEI